MLQSLDIKKLKQFKMRSSTVLRDLVTIGNQTKNVLLYKIRKSSIFGLLIDEVTDISNIQNLLTFIRKRGEPHSAFINSTDFLGFSDTNLADSQTIHNCLINLVSN